MRDSSGGGGGGAQEKKSQPRKQGEKETRNEGREREV
jgi:hypothetical protein